MWSEREHDRDGVLDSAVLVVMCDVDEKSALIDAASGVLFSTPHYDGHGAMLVRLDDVEPGELAGYVEYAYRCKATARLLADFDSA